MSNPSNPIKFILIGCGRIGERHAKHMAAVGSLVAVCDILEESAQKLASAYNCNAFLSLEALIASKPQADVVAICTPNYLHAPQTIACLNASYHVICEKPMALSVYDCGQMIKAADEANKRLFIVKQNRYNPPVVALKKWLDIGKLGKLLSIQLNCFWNRNADYYQSNWKGGKYTDGGILYTQFSHFIDLVYWLIGDMRKVQSYHSNQSGRSDIEFEDTLVAICEFYNGAMGSLHFTINSTAQNMEGSLTIFGTEGTVKIGGQYLNTLEYVKLKNHEEVNMEPGNPPNQYGTYTGSMSNHDKVYANVVEVLTNNGIIATNGFEGLKTVEMIDKIYSNN